MKEDKDGYDKLADAMEKGPVKGGWHLMKIVAILLVLGTLLFGTLGFVFGIFGQGARIVQKTLDADNVLYNYEWFKQQKEDIDTLAIKHISSWFETGVPWRQGLCCLKSTGPP